MKGTMTQTALALLLLWPLVGAPPSAPAHGNDLVADKDTQALARIQRACGCAIVVMS